MPKLVKTFSLSASPSLSICLFLCVSVKHTHTHTHTHTQFVCLLATLNLSVVTTSLHAGKHRPLVPCLPANPYSPSSPITVAPALWNFFFHYLFTDVFIPHILHWHWMAAQWNTGQRTSQPWFYHLPVLWPWPSALISVCLGNLIFKLGKIIVTIHKTTAMD